MKSQEEFGARCCHRQWQLTVHGENAMQMQNAKKKVEMSGQTTLVVAFANKRGKFCLCVKIAK